MKIRTTIITTIERKDGSGVTLDRTVVSEHGDNPSFERSEAAGALRVAMGQFIDSNALGGTRPL